MNKRVLITGATSGIGLETAKALANLNFDVTIIGRNEEKLKQVVNSLSNSSIEVDYIVADLSLMKDVQKAADTFKNRHTSIDVLINNAGLIAKEYHCSIEGFEESFATNHLAPFLLTNLLLGQLMASDNARVINISSAAHNIGKINFNDIMFKNKFSSSASYAQAKLANILFTYELSRRLKGTRCTVNCLHPGVVNSNFSEGLNPFYKFFWRLFTPFLLSTQKGAETTIYLATSEFVQNVSGKYFVNKKEKTSSTLSYDENTAKRLWEYSEKLCGITAII